MNVIKAVINNVKETIENITLDTLYMVTAMAGTTEQPIGTIQQPAAVKAPTTGYANTNAPAQKVLTQAFGTSIKTQNHGQRGVAHSAHQRTYKKTVSSNVNRGKQHTRKNRNNIRSCR